MKLAIFSIILVLSISKNSSSQDPFENSIASLSKIITDSLNNSGKKQIAVTSITESDNRGQNLREYIRESVEEYVHANSKGYKVLERQKLQLVLDEQKVSSEAIINDSTRVKLGRLFGVDAIVLGSITLTTNEIKLSLRAIDIVTGEIIALKSQVISKTERIKDLLEEQIKTEDKAQQAIQPVPEYNDPDCELKNRGPFDLLTTPNMIASWCRAGEIKSISLKVNPEVFMKN